MSEDGDSRAATRTASRLRARLYAARWVVVASSSAIVGLTLWQGGPWLLAGAAVAMVVAAAALAPRRGGRPHVATGVSRAAADGATPVTALELAEALPDPLIIFDENASVLFANSMAREVFGDLPVGLLLPLKFRSSEMQGLIMAPADAAPATIEHAERVPIERIFRVSLMPFGETRGHRALLFKDQSEVRRIDRMRADFIANASHELRTPLASISGFIETLRGPARDDPKAREAFLEIMQGQTSRMARLIDDLLSLSRLEMKPLHRSADKHDIAALLEDVIGAHAQRAREAGVEISIAAPGGPLQVPGSRDELTQVFENLLENAIKYGRSGGLVEVTIEPFDAAQRPEVAVTVRDHGPGIPEEHIPRVTERFYRVDSETGPAQKGTGLGLSIVKHIMQRHDGRLTIRSARGEGAAFTVHLPLD